MSSYRNRESVRTLLLVLILVLVVVVTNCRRTSGVSQELSPKLQEILVCGKLEPKGEAHPGVPTYLLTLTHADYLSLTADEAASLLRAAYAIAKDKEPSAKDVYVSLVASGMELVPFAYVLPMHGKVVPESFRKGFRSFQCGLETALKRREEIKTKIRWLQEQAEGLVKDWLAGVPREDLGSRASQISGEWWDRFVDDLTDGYRCMSVFLEPESHVKNFAYGIVLEFESVNEDADYQPDEDDLKEMLRKMNAVTF